jgi:hypothetical protein
VKRKKNFSEGEKKYLLEMRCGKLVFIHSGTSILKRQLGCTPEKVVKDSADDGVVKRIIK